MTTSSRSVVAFERESEFGQPVYSNNRLGDGGDVNVIALMTGDLLGTLGT